MAQVFTQRRWTTREAALLYRKWLVNSDAALAAVRLLADAQLERRDVDGLVCGYSTTMPHLMLSTVFAEHFGLKPGYAHAIQLGGAG